MFLENGCLYGKHEYLFPARPNVRFREVEKFSRPHAWDLGKRFRRICTKAKISDLRIHDLRHFATTMLFIEGVADALIRKMTGHRSEELERYKHLSPAFKQQTVELIAGRLTRHVSTFLSPEPKNTNGLPEGRPKVLRLPPDNGGADGTRTRDLRRDSSILEPHNQPETIDEKDTWLEWAKDEEKVPYRTLPVCFGS